MPRRIQRKRTKGWQMPPNTEYVGRPTTYANPFRLRHFVSLATPLNPTAIDEWVVETDNGGSFTGKFKTKQEAASASVKLFYMAARAHRNSADSWRRKVVFALRGKDLACWCPLDQPCHADVLLEIANSDGGNGDA